MPARFEELLIFVRDVEAAARFYERTLGLARRRSGEGFVVLDGGATRLAFQKRELAVRHGGESVLSLDAEGPPPPFELAFDVEDVDAAYARGVEAGGEPLEDPHTTEWGDRIAHLRDTNGILVGLSLARPK